MYLIRLLAEECCASGSLNLKLCSCRKKKKKTATNAKLA